MPFSYSKDKAVKIFFLPPRTFIAGFFCPFSSRFLAKKTLKVMEAYLYIKKKKMTKKLQEKNSRIFCENQAMFANIKTQLIFQKKHQGFRKVPPKFRAKNCLIYGIRQCFTYKQR